MKIFRTDQERLSRLTDHKNAKNRDSVLVDSAALGAISKRIRSVSHSSDRADSEQVLTNADSRGTFPQNS